MILECTEVKKIFQEGKNKNEVLKSVDLNVQENEFITIMGKSGSGKTTFLNCISLLSKVTSGSIKVDGKDISKCKEKELEIIRQQKIGMVFQNANLISCLSTLDNLIIAMHDKQAYHEKKKRAIALLENIDMQEKANAKATTLSGGERQRIAILRALVNNPKIIVCDEPTGALDGDTSKEVMQFLIDICRSYKSALIIVTHDVSIGDLGSKKYIMERGMLHEA